MLSVLTGFSAPWWTETAQQRMSLLQRWSWVRREQSCLVSAVITKPVSSIWTLIRGGKGPVIDKAWDESCGQKSATGVSPLIGILIPLLISACGCYFFLVVKQSFTLSLHAQWMAMPYIGTWSYKAQALRLTLVPVYHCPTEFQHCKD